MHSGVSHLNKTYLTQVCAQVARVCLEMIYFLSLCSSSAIAAPLPGRAISAVSHDADSTLVSDSCSFFIGQIPER